MTTYPTAAIREAMLRAGCSLAQTDAAMFHLSKVVTDVNHKPVKRPLDFDPTLGPASASCGSCGGTGVDRDGCYQCNTCRGTGAANPRRADVRAANHKPGLSALARNVKKGRGSR